MGENPNAPPEHLEMLGRRFSPGLPNTLGAMLERRQSSTAAPQLRPTQEEEHDPHGPPMGSTTVLLQAFNWECSKRGMPSWYSILASRAAAIAAVGITAVWLPPPSASVAPEGYLPRELEDLQSCYGSERDLRLLLRALRKLRVRALADVVLNHRCAGKQDEGGRWNRFTGRYAWDAGCVCSGDERYGGRGAPKGGARFDAAPNIDHTNPRVQKDIKSWLSWLRQDVGYDGLRLDFVKGFKGEQCGDYVDSCQPLLCVGEWWDDCAYEDVTRLAYNQDSHRQRIVDWCDATLGRCAAFDFTTKAILQEAVAKREYWRLRDEGGKPPGVVGWWPSRAVTFCENHDTGSTQQHWPFPEAELPQGYAYILSHPGTPCIFYDHLWTDGQLKPSLWRRLRAAVAGPESSALSPLRSTLIALIALRKRCGITSDSEVHIHEASGSNYAAVVGRRLAVRLGPGRWSPARARVDVGQKAWLVAVSGRGFCTWEALLEA